MSQHTSESLAERDPILANRGLEQAVIRGEQVALASIADVQVHGGDPTVPAGAALLERDLAVSRPEVRWKARPRQCSDAKKCMK